MTLGTALSIMRYHIMLVAMTATLVFGWLMTGEYPFAIAAVVGLDWFLINLFNRVTDIEEDLENGIVGTAEVAKRRRLLTIALFALQLGSLAVTAVVAPRLFPFRCVVQAIGLAYSYRLVPTPRGWKRLKELYFLKNFGSAVLFVLTCFVYPLAQAAWHPIVSWGAIAALVVFFVPFELTYEILYDLRDLPGDRAAGIPTYPVVHGQTIAMRIIDALLVLAAATIIVAIGARALGMREGLMLFAPLAQWIFYRPRVARGLTSRDCIALTHLGSAQLVLFLIGTAAWLRAGLPANLYL